MKNLYIRSDNEMREIVKQKIGALLIALFHLLIPIIIVIFNIYRIIIKASTGRSPRSVFPHGT